MNRRRFPRTAGTPGSPPDRPRTSAWRRVRGAAYALLAVYVLAACGDLPLLGSQPEFAPVSARLHVVTNALTVGESTPFRLELVDREGRVLEGLPPWAAAWTIAGAGVDIDRGRFAATASGLASVTVDVGGLRANTQLRIQPVALEVRIAAAYVNQAVQRLDGSLPLVAGRDGHLRVFLTGDVPNFFRPPIRIRFFHDGRQTAVLDARATFDGIPQQITEGDMGRSWNVRLPGSLIQPGASFLVEVDAGPDLPATPASSLRYPASGTPQPLDVRVVPRFDITFVPVEHIGGGTANVWEGNVEQFMAATRAVWPIHETSVRVRQPFVTATRAATAEGWNQILQEIRLLWIAEGRQGYYHGIVRREGSWAGLGYVGLPVAITYDQLPAASWTVAHELGHNFQRRHAPCGGPDGVDTAYPHANGGIGAWGISADGSLYPPTQPDLMSYCSPRWVSDYSYSAVFNFRQASGGSGRDAQLDAQPVAETLLVSGEIDSRGIRLDPALRIATRPYLPASPGPYAVEGLDASGALLFRHEFAGDELGHGPAEVRHFAFAIPLSPSAAARLVTLRATGGGHTAVRTAATGAASASLSGAELFTLRPGNGGSALLEWDAARFPLVAVRDAASHRVLTFARGGSAQVPAFNTPVELLFSDGVQTISRRADASQF
jgi:hypothetical protein